MLVLRSRADFTLDGFFRVAWQGEGVRLAAESLACVGAARAAFLALHDSDPNLVIYGVTSGYGQNAHLRFTPEERKAHAR